jgi:hypothetical protein
MQKMTISHNNPNTRALWFRLDLDKIRALDNLIEYLHSNPRAFRCYELADVMGVSVQAVRGLLGYLQEIKAVTREIIGTENIERTHKDGTPYTLTVEIAAFRMVAYYPNPEPVKVEPKPARVYKSILQEIAEAQNAEDMRAVHERIEHFAFCAEMADNYADTLKERAQADTYRTAYAERLVILGLA